jgi:CheY-like chemotaxis protein
MVMERLWLESSMLRIVVVEEDRLMRRLLVECLESAGYEVRAFSSGSDATGPAPDLVIADVCMPRRGGREKLAAVRTKWPATPLIAISTQFHEGSLTPSGVARELGAKQLVAKPFSRQTLLSAVRDATLKAPAA